MSVLSELKVGETLHLSENSIIHRKDDGYYNEHGIKVEHTPGAMVPVVERGLFHPDIHKEIVKFVQDQAFNFDVDNNEFMRRGAHNVPFFRYIHEQLKDTACDIFKEEVIPSYVYLSMYNEYGVCPFHTDRPQCKYTIDYCVDQDAIWPIYVDDTPYELEPNDALCYSGTDSPHFRFKNPGGYAWLVFFHFVPKGFSGSLT